MDNAIVVYQSGQIAFNNYDDILKQAQELAEHVSSVVVTEESVKATKKMLAEVNKKVNELENGRKAIKKELLAPYEEFEQKIKSITSVVKQADNMVRSQVRELEEKEREEKQSLIVELFNKRLRLYPMIEGVFEPFDFIKASHLNKSAAMTKVEGEMVQWFEQRKQDIEFISKHPQADEVMVEYVKTQNVVDSLNIIIDRNQAKAKINKKETVIHNSVSIVIGENDLKTVEVFMKSLNINYTLKRGN